MGPGRRAGDRRGEEMLERKLATALARAPFHLTAARENGSGFRMDTGPPRCAPLSGSAWPGNVRAAALRPLAPQERRIEKR